MSSFKPQHTPPHFGGLEGAGIPERAGSVLGGPGTLRPLPGPPGCLSAAAAGLHSGLGASAGPHRSLLTLDDGLDRGPGGRRVPSPVGGRRGRRAAAAGGRGAGPAHGSRRPPGSAARAAPALARPPSLPAALPPGPLPRRELIAVRRPRRRNRPQGAPSAPEPAGLGAAPVGRERRARVWRGAGGHGPRRA